MTKFMTRKEVNGESVNEVGERPTNKNNKRPSALPGKQRKKAVSLEHQKWREAKQKQLDSTSLVDSVLAFEKKHRRLADITEITNLFALLQHDDDETSLPSVQNFTSGYTKYIPCCKNLRRKRKKLASIKPQLDWYSPTSHFPIPQSREKRKNQDDKHDKIDQDFVLVPPLSTPDEDKYFSPEFINKNIGKLEKLLSSLRDVLPTNDQYLSFFEDILTLVYAYYRNTPWDVITLLVISMIKQKTGTSFTASCEEIFTTFYESEKPVQQSGVFSYVRSFPQLFRSNLFTHINKAIVLLITYGFLDPINISCRGLNVFAACAAEKATSAIDLFEYIIDIFAYFFEAAYKLFNKDYSIFYDLDELNQIDRNIIILSSNIDKIRDCSYERDTGKTVGEFKQLLMDTYNDVEYMSRIVKDKVTKQNVVNKLEKLAGLVIKFNSFNAMGGLRKAPFSVSLFGTSSVGKSTLANIIINSTMVFNGFDCSDEQICTLQPDDRFYSTYKQNTLAVIIDDVSNTVAAKATVNPASMIISLVNNIKYTAPKADTKDKGMFQVEPHIVVATSNVRDLGASAWSQEPLSVLRRLSYHLTVKVKQAYATTSGKFDASKMTSEDIEFQLKNGFCDAWLIDVHIAKASGKPSNGGCEMYDFELVKLEDGTPATNINIYQLIKFLNTKSEIHYKQQTNLVKVSCNAGKKMSFCKGCKNFAVVCRCGARAEIINPQPVEDIGKGPLPEQQSLVLGRATDIIAGTIASTIYNSVLRFYQDMCPTPLESFIGSITGYSVADYVRHRYLSLLNYIPLSVRETELYRSFHVYRHRKRLILYTQIATVSAFSIVGYGNYRHNRCVPQSLTNASIAGIATGTISWRILYAHIMDELRTKPYREVINQQNMELVISCLFKAGVTLAAGLTVVKVVRSLYGLFNMTPQGNLSPTSIDDIQVRDAEKNHWTKSSVSFEKFEVSKTMTGEQLVDKIQGNCLNASFEYEGNVRVIGVVAIKSNKFLCPLHFFHEASNIKKPLVKGALINGTFEKDCVMIKLVRAKNTFFSGRLNLNDIVRIGSHDLCIFTLASGGSFSDIIPYICNEWKFSGPIRGCWRDPFGEYKKWTGNATNGSHQYCVCMTTNINFDGGSAEYSVPTDKGMCGAVLVADVTMPHIIGFHLAGHSGRTSAFYVTPKRDELETAITKLNKMIGIIEIQSEGHFRQTRYGKSVSYTVGVSDLSPVCWQQFEPYIIRGSIGLQSTTYPTIRPTILSKSFHEITGLDPIWGPPKIYPSWWGWAQFLEQAAQPVTNMDSNLLLRAKKDYIGKLLPLYVKYKEVVPNGPLNVQAIINGIPGIRYVDSMNFGSSFGYPLSGAKRKLLQGEPGNFTFVNQPEIDEEIAAMNNAYLSGERFYPIFKACYKDEPVKKSKPKVRIFHAAEMSLQFQLRKYFLPVARILHMHPLVSECAVGINPQCDEWDQLHKYITFNGTQDDRILAGDYSKWDIRLPPDVVLMAFTILIELAQAFGTYSEDDLCIMRGLATDVTYYLCHFNGTLIEFMSGVPSGHNLTAVLNSICNSLLLRCGYFASGETQDFRLNCHAMTYGDDFESGVLPKVKKFDHLFYRDFLAKHGMKLTMPIKDALPQPFLNVWQCDFLKRRSVICPYDSMIYGALDVESINKSIVVKGKTTSSPREHAYDVLYGCVRELSFHDKETYDYWIDVYRKISRENNLVVKGMNMSHKEYYKYRNGIMDDGTLISINLSSHDRPLVGYPMIQEASDGRTQSLSEVSSLDEVGSFELDSLFNLNELTELLNNESYLHTKVGEGGADPLLHMKPENQSGTMAHDVPTQDAQPITSGILNLSGGKEESILKTELISKDLLSLRQDEGRSLGQYLSRPYLIGERELIGWNGESFDILYDFLSSPRIRDKVRYYAYLNGVLNVKVTCVGSPQCTGAIQVALHPWNNRDNSLGPMSGNTTRVPHKTQRSQLPNFVIDVGAETGGHIAMPIIAPTNGLNISETDQIVDAFKLHVYSLHPTLAPATAPNVKPSIQIYAWIDDVSLTGTTMNSELPIPQSDEYQVDPASVGTSATTSFKTGLAAAAGEVVGKATELGAMALMSAVGLSQPLSPFGVTPIVPRLATNMACYNSDQNIDSLASDIKNEVELGTKELGYSDTDHMSLENINRRWTLLGPFEIDAQTVPGLNVETVAIPVSPLAVPVEPLGNTPIFYPTALAASTLPFAKWRGGIEYKIQAIGSAFLKGKMKISHDVNARVKIGAVSRNTLDVQALNTVIWDISQYRTITIQVPWTSNLAFKDTGNLRDWYYPNIVDETPFDSTSNGVLLIDKLSHISDQSFTHVRFLISVRAMEGFAYGDVRAVLANYVFAGVNFGQDPGVPEPQSGELEVLPAGLFYSEDGSICVATLTADNVAFYNAYLASRYQQNDLPTPQSGIIKSMADVTTFGGQTSDTELIVNITGLENSVEDNGKMMELCMGEKFFHLRQIIKRYTENFTRNYWHGSTANQKLRRLRLPDRPLLKGWQGPNSLNTDPNGKKVTYARDSFLSFFSVCFLGYRGSYRHKVLLSSNVTTQSLVTYIARSPQGYLEEVIDFTSSAALNMASAILLSPDVRAGGTVGAQSINPIIEYSTPFQCRAKFAWAQDRTPYTPKFTYDGGFDIPWHLIAYMTGETNNKWVRLSKFIAAGDDFSLFYYMYAPAMSATNPALHPQG